MPSILDTLSSCPDLMGFSNSEFNELALISQLMTFNKGHVVFSVEHGDQYLFIVADGLLSLRLHREHVSKEFKSQDLFGEIVLFSNRGRMGAIRCLEKSTLLAIDKNGILQENEHISTSTRFKFLQRMGDKMAGYFYQETKKDTEELLEETSSEQLAFTPSIEDDHWNFMVKTVAAFMNLNGGSLICGITEDGQITDMIPTRDEVDAFEQKFRVILQQHLGDDLPEVYIDFKFINQYKLVRIDIQAASFPIFYQEHINGKAPIERFYIRTGHTNHPLRMASEMVTYIQNRFKLELKK